MVDEVKAWDVDKDIVSEYQEFNNENSFNTEFQEPRFFKEIGDISGKNVLDLACGSGHYTRQIKRKKANLVVGADINEHMITEAKRIDEKDDLGIKYFAKNALTFSFEDNFEFDMVIAAWLLTCASTFKELLQFCRTAYNHLTPGGRFVTLTAVLHDDTIELAGKYDPITLRTATLEAGEWCDGCQPRVTLFSDPEHPCMSFNDYYWTFDTINGALHQVGFTNVVKSYVHPKVNSVIVLSAMKP